MRYQVDMQKVEYRVFEGNMSPFWLEAFWLKEVEMLQIQTMQKTVEAP